MTTALCVVPCGKAKVWDKEPRRGRTAAKHVYTGSFATATRKYAEEFYPGSWVILSAKHGFLLPDDVVAGPYEVSFNKPGPAVITREQLALQIVERGLARYRQVVVVSGRAYVAAVRAAFASTDAEVVAPLVGLGGMGTMIARLKRARLEGAIVPLST